MSDDTEDQSSLQPQPEPEPEPLPWHPAAQYSSRPMVRWLSPREMIRGGYGEFLGGLFGAFADSREAQAALRPATVHCRSDATRDTTDFEIDPLAFHGEGGNGPEELWVDYVADIGDGFSPTYAIARQLARPTLDVTTGDGEQHTLPRGAMTVLGGDEVYPVAGAQHYQERTIGPYRTAFDDVDEKTPMFAVPGNHDWYDGLVAFLEQFTVLRAAGNGWDPEVDHDPTDPARWTTHQTRSYFAVQLSEKWWLWAIDIALEAHIDSPQMQYFSDLRAAMPADSRIILCTAKPAWLGRQRHSPAAQKWQERLRPYKQREAPEPDSWDRLRYFMKATLGETDATTAEPGADGADAASRPQVRLVLSGDKHFYARHEADDPTAPTFVTAGGGGAYLSSTLDAHDTLDVPLEWYDQRTTEYNAKNVWPSREQSVRIGLTALWRLPIRNVSLAMLFGCVYTLFGLAAWSIQTAGDDTASRVDGLAERNIVAPLSALGRSPTGLVFGAVVAVALLALASAHRVPKLRAFPVAALHIGLHVLAVGASIWLAALAAQQDNGFGVLIVPIGITCIAIFEAWLRRAQDQSTDWRPSIIAMLVTVVLAFAQFGINLLNVEIGVYVFVMASFGIGAALGTMAFTVYLVIAQFARVNTNELFVGLRHEGYKHFVRLRVTDDKVEVFVVGYEHVARRHIIWENNRPQVTPTPKKVSAVGHELVDHFSVDA